MMTDEAADELAKLLVKLAGSGSLKEAANILLRMLLVLNRERVKANFSSVSGYMPSKQNFNHRAMNRFNI